MKSSYLPFLIAVSLLAVAGTVLAQEDAPAGEADSGGGKVYAELGVWVSQPSGLEFEPAMLIDTADPFSNTILTYPIGTNRSGHYRAGYDFGGNVGSVIMTWTTHSDEYPLTDFRQGDFVFGEILADPLFAGYRNDGLADGVDARSSTVLRDLRFDYYRNAFRSSRISGRWFVGYRRVTHKREQMVDYFAILPNLPSVTFPPPPSEPRPELFPDPDSVAQISKFEGRGFGAGLEVSMPLIQDKLFFESGVNIAVLRGKTDVAYRSTTHAYTVGGVVLPVSDYQAYFGTTGLFESIQQVAINQGLETTSRSSSASVFEIALAVRWRILRWLEAFGGFRNVRYDDVGTELRTGPPFFGVNTNLASVQEIERSVSYEGFYGGIALRF